MTDQQRMKRLEKSQVRTLFRLPFFAPGVAKLRNQFGDVPTACTDGSNITWGREFFDKLNDDQIVTVLCHEVSHCLLGHLWRAPECCDWERWNEATDHAVNNMLKEFSEQVTSKGLADPLPFPEGQFCCDAAFRNKSEETIYAALNRQKPPGGGGGNKPGSGKGGGKGKVGQPGQSATGRKPFGEIKAPTGTDAQKKQGKTEWESTLIQSVEAAKQRGDLPGSMERYVKELLSPAVPWWEVLRSWIREQANDDWNWMKPNKLYADSGMILPVLDSERMTAVYCGIDTSGSISSGVLTQFKSEEQGILDTMKPEMLTEICCDSRITSEREFRPGDTISGDAPGGGGTRLEKIFERIEERGVTPKCVVILTDLETTFPKVAPAYPVLWVVWGGKDSAPFGEVVKVQQP